MTRSTWSRVVARLFDKKKTQAGEQARRRLTVEWLEARLAPATSIWTGLGGANNLWSNANNWSRNGLAAAPQAGDDLLFDSRTNNRTTNNDLAAGFSISSITISASNYTLGGATSAQLGNRITLGATGIHVLSGSTNEKVALDLQLGVSGIGPTAFNFTVDNGAALTVSGHVSGVANATLAKNGSGNGTLVLTNDNTVLNAALGSIGMNGAITVQTGTLSITNSNALGSLVGATNVLANAQLQLGATGLSVAENLNLNGPGTLSDGALLNAVGTNTWTGIVSMDSDATIGGNAATVLTISGLVTDTGSGHNLTKEGAGQIIFSRVGGNTYRGLTTINNGILTIQDALSLGAGADSTKPQSGTPQSGTIVNSNTANGTAGTLQLMFTSVAANDPNGILQDPTLPFNAITNQYVGFQVFGDLLTLNGVGFGGIGALSNSAGNNAWDGDVKISSAAPNLGTASIGAATGSQLTISGFVQDGAQKGSITKVLPGRLILNNNNTYTGTTTIAAGALQISDSKALGAGVGAAGAVTVSSGAALEMAVDSGLDGTALRTHNRNLGFDSTNKTGPGQELFVTPGGTAASPTGSFRLTYQGQQTGVFLYNATAAQIKAGLEQLSTINAGGGTVTVTGAGGLFRIIFNGPLANTNVPLITANTFTGGLTAVINPIYGLNVTKNLTIAGTGIVVAGALPTGALRSISGINTYSGPITLSGTAGIGVDADSRGGHPLADANYFTNDYSLSITTNITGGSLEKDSTGHLILTTSNNYTGTTHVTAGWITIEDSGALGSNSNAVGDTVQTAVTVDSGAAIHLKAVTGTGLTIAKNFILSGLGISHPYSLLNQEGALLNLNGANVISGEVSVTGNVGLGAQTLAPQVNNSQSQLTFTGAISEFQAPSRTVTTTVSGGSFQTTNTINTGFTNGGTISLTFDFRVVTDRVQILSGATVLYDSLVVNGPKTILVDYPPSASGLLTVIVNPGQFSNFNDQWRYTAIVMPKSPGIVGGITKLGNSRIYLQAPGTFTGAVDVKEGTLIAQNASALGLNSSGTSSGTASFTSSNTTVEAGAQLQVGNTLPSNNGGLQAGSQIANENLFLNGQAQQLNVSGIGGTYTLTYNNGTYSATTVALAYNAPASGGLLTSSSVQNALNAILLPLGGSVTVTQSGNVFTVVFGGNLASIANPTLTATTPLTDSTLAVSITNIASSLAIISGDNLWTGGLTLSANSTLDIASNSRFTVQGSIDDATNLSNTGSSLTKVGNGELVLQGSNTYNGTTYINQGVLTAANSLALGNSGTSQAIQNVTVTGSFQFRLTFNGQQTILLNSTSANLASEMQAALNNLSSIKGDGTGFVTVVRGPLGNVFTVTFSGAFLVGQSLPLMISSNAGAVVTSVATGFGGTVVASGAQLNLRGNLNIAAESLTILGTGPNAGTAPTTIPVQWFAAGPAPINGGQTAGSQAVSGRVTGVAVDPTDDRVMYISTAGGGAWKTIDGGTTWTQLFDGVSAIQNVTVTGNSGTFTLKYGTDTTAAIPFNATAQQVQDALNLLPSILGANNTGSVTVSLNTTGTNTNIYTITFSGGSLANSAVTTLIAAHTAGISASTVAVVPNGAGSPFALFTGAIAVSSSNPQVIYLATGEANNSGDSYYGTGIYKSTDSGRTWALVVDNSTTPNPLYGQVVSKIVVDDTNSNLFYAATSDLGANAPTLVANAGVWRYDTVNGWFNLTATTSTARGVAAAGPGTAGPEDDFKYVFKQTNVDWSDLVLVGPKGQQVLIAAMGIPSGNTSNAVFRNFAPTSNTAQWYVGGSATLTPPAANTPSGEFPAGDFTTGIPVNGLIRIAATTTPVYNAIGNPEGLYYNLTTVYASVTYPNNPFLPGNGNTYNTYKVLYKATFTDRNVFDAAGNIIIYRYDLKWAAVSTVGLAPFQGTVANGNNQGDYDSFIAVAPNDPNIVYVGGVVDYAGATIYNNQILTSKDGGLTWTDISIDATGKGPHTDQHAVAVNAEGQLIVGNDGGIFRSDAANPTKPYLWTDLNGNLNTIQFNGIAQNPIDPSILIGSSQDNGAEITTGGQTWTLTDQGDGGEIDFDPLNPNIAYHVQNGSLRRSTDGGQTWSTVTAVNNQYFPIVVDQINTSRLLLASGFSGDLEESLNADGAANPTFANIGVNLPFISINPLIRMSVTALAISTYQGSLPNGTYQFDPSFPLVGDKGSSTYDRDTIYVTDGSRIAVTKDHGQSWTFRNIAAFNGNNISALTVDPRNRDTVYAISDDPNGTNSGSPNTGRVFKSTDAGQTWVDISGTLPDMPATKLVVDPRTGSLYIGNDNGVWYLPQGTTNGAFTAWQRFGAGLPRVRVTDIELNLNLNLMTIGTYGRGAFQLYLSEVTPDSGALHVESGTATWTGSVVLTGNTTINVGGSQSLPDGSAAAVLNIVGQISDVTPNAKYSLTKDGQGTLVLSGANTYSGWTDIKTGVLLVNNPQALGTFNAGVDIVAQGGTTVESGAALQLEADLQGEPVVLNGDGIQPGLNNHNTGALRNVNGNNTYTGTLTLNTNTTIGVNSGSQLTIGTSPILTGTGTIAGLAASSLTKELTGTLVLGTANAYQGSTRVNQGALQVQNATALGTGAAAAVVLDGAQMQIQNDALNTPLNVTKNLILSGTGIFGTGALLNTGGKNTWSGSVTFASLPGFSPSSTPSGSVYVGTANSGDALTISGVVGESAGEPSGLTKIGQGTVILTNANTYSGSTSILQGTLEIQNSNALGTRNTTAAVQRFTTLSDQQTGQFIASFSGPNGVKTTTLNYGATAAQVITALNTLLNSAGYSAAELRVSVTRTNVQTTTQNGLVPLANNTGYLYTVLFVGTQATTTQEFSVSGTQGTIAAESKVADGGVGTLVAIGAELDLHSTTVGVPISVPSTMELALNGSGVSGGGALRNLSGANNGMPNVWAGQVDLQSDSTINVDNNTTLALTGTGGGFGANLTKTGPGTLQIDGNFSNTFVLNTVVLSDINFILNGGTLSGIGTLGPVNALTGTLSPGDNLTTQIGTLTTGPIGSLNASDQVFVDLGDPTTSTSDLLMVNGSINLNGASLNGKLVGTGHAPGDTFTIIQTDYNGGANPNDIVTGKFAGVPLAGNGTQVTINGTQFRVDYLIDQVILTQLNDSTSTTVAGAPNPSVYGQAVTFTASVTYTGVGTPTGTITFKDGSTTLGIGTYNSGTGIWSFTTSATALTVGNHSITAVYTSNNGFPGSTSTPTIQTVNQSATNIALTTSPNPSSTGQAVTLRATVTPAAPGSGLPTQTVNFFDGGIDISGAITLDGSGVATYITSSLSVGNHSITAVYNGDLNFSAKTSVIKNQTVLAAQPTSTSVVSSLNPSIVGNNVTFTATVTNIGSGNVTPGGNVEFFDGAIDLGAGTSIGSGQWTFAIASLTAGAHNITAVYGGDVNYLTSTSPTFVQNVNTAAGSQSSTTTVSSSANPSVVNQPVTFTATVTSSFAGTPTGNVVFKDGAITLGNGTSQGNGKWTFVATPSTTGAHSITAVYGGDSVYATSTGALTQNVSTIGSNTSFTSVVMSSANPSAVGQAVTFSVTVGTAPGVANANDGTVTFFDGATMLGTGTVTNGRASFTTSSLALGNHPITATYGGNTYFAASSSPSALNQAVQTAVVGSNTSFTSVVVSSANPSAVGQAVTFSVTVGTAQGVANANDGVVTFFDGATMLGTGSVSNGRASFTTSSLALGNHSITATYGGNTYFAASSSPSALTQTVQATVVGSNASFTSVVRSTANPANLGQAVTLSVTVGTAPGVGNADNGVVTFFDGATIIGTGTVFGGVASITTSSLALGTHSITASYGGSSYFATSSSPSALTQVVKQGTTTTMISSAQSAPAGSTLTFTATVTSPSGTPTGQVAFYDSGFFFGYGTYVGNNQWTFTTNIFTTVGDHFLTAAYLGDSTFNASMSPAYRQTITGSGRG